VAKNPHEKALQRALIQYSNPENYELVKEALQKCGRMDLIGFGEKCLIRPRKLSKEKNISSSPKSNTMQNSRKQSKNVNNKKSGMNIQKKSNMKIGKEETYGRKRKR